jgi:hypothetical protein
MDDFEREIEFELRRAVDPMVAAPIPPRRTVRSRATRTRAIVGGAGAAVALKLVSGVVAAAAAVTVAGAATTGSLDPAIWGQQVSTRVEQCKAELATGRHGIGDCVSSFAKTHGAAVASEARHRGLGHGNGNGSSNSNDTGDVIGHDKNRAGPNPPGKNGRPSPDAEPTDPPGRPPVTIRPPG